MSWYVLRGVAHPGASGGDVPCGIVNSIMNEWFNVVYIKCMDTVLCRVSITWSLYGIGLLPTCH